MTTFCVYCDEPIVKDVRDGAWVRLLSSMGGVPVTEGSSGCMAAVEAGTRDGEHEPGDDDDG